MAKEFFHYPETAQLLKLLDETAHRSRVSRYQAFEDTLTMIRSALGRPLMEQEYLDAVKHHSDGPQGKRGVDSIVRFFASLVSTMEETNHDHLGDLFESSISHGEGSQFLTPEHLAILQAKLTLPTEPTGIEDRRTISDPCCGSGRMLLAAADIQPHWHFIGQDIDFRAVQMTAINLALRNRYGHVIWGNTLQLEERRIFETGRFQVYGNAIREVRVPQCPKPVQRLAESPPPTPSSPGEQLTLF